MASAASLFGRLARAAAMLCAAMVALCMLLPHARAAPRRRVALAGSAAPRNGRWQTLQVGLRIPPALRAVSVTVRDARGGPAFTRRVSGAGQHIVLLPLPFIQGAGLPPGRWPVRVILSTPDTAPTVNLVRVHRRMPAATRALHVLIRNSAARPPLADYAAFGRTRVTYLRASLQQILNDPPLVFASCDVLFVDPGLASQLGTSRTAALIACGLRLVYPGYAPPDRSSPSLWVQPPNSPNLWVAPPEYHALHRRPLVARAAAVLQRQRVPPPPSLANVVYLSLPLALALLAIVRLADVPPGRMAITLAIVFGLGGGGAVLVMRHSLNLIVRHFSWTTRTAPGAVALRESFNGYGTFFPSRSHLGSTSPMPALPMAASARAWFALHCRITLEGGAARTRMHLPRARMQYFAARSAVPRQALPPLPTSPATLHAFTDQLAAAGVDLHSGEMIYNGYIYGARGRERFTAWLRSEPVASRLALHSWYATAFAAGRLYHLDRIGRETPWHLSLVDFGKPMPQLLTALGLQK